MSWIAASNIQLMEDYFNQVALGTKWVWDGIESFGKLRTIAIDLHPTKFQRNFGRVNILWATEGSNFRPPSYQDGALPLSY